MDWVAVLGVIAASAIAFLGFGMVWIGQPALQACVAVLFLLLAYTVSHMRGRNTSLMVTALPTAPVAWLIAQFRDVNDSHAISIAIVLAWALGIFLGAVAADRARTSFRRLLACVAGMTALHAVLAVIALLTSFGDSMDRFDGKSVSASAGWVGTMTDALMHPLLTLFTGSTLRLSPAAQWLAFGVNSLTWGAVLGVLLACALRLKAQPAPPA